MKRIGHETFAESVELYKVPDVDFYIATGINAMERREQWRALYRLHLDLKNGAVHWELLATLNARFLQWEEAEFGDRDELGERVGIFGARGRGGHPFLFRLAERHFQNTRAIGKAIYPKMGAGGGFIVPGKAPAMMRAIFALSKEGEPMPHDDKELRALLQDKEEEVDPFGDD